VSHTVSNIPAIIDGHLSTTRIIRGLSQDTTEETHLSRERVKIAYDHVVQSLKSYGPVLFSFFPIRENRLSLNLPLSVSVAFTQRFDGFAFNTILCPQPFLSLLSLLPLLKCRPTLDLVSSCSHRPMYDFVS
jgi:hypothetical protein